MNNNTIKVLFLLAKNRPNKMGKCTIKCRITYCKERREFSTGLFINPKNWNSKQQLVKPLKEIEVIIGIDKGLTTHIARKPLASTVSLYKYVPLEIVSKLLGHSSMNITHDSYGKQ